MDLAVIKKWFDREESENDLRSEAGCFADGGAFVFTGAGAERISGKEKHGRYGYSAVTLNRTTSIVLLVLGIAVLGVKFF